MILSKKGKRTFTGNVATEWGTRFEPIATMIYEKEFSTTVHEFGLLIHEQHHFLGASPDGCTTGGVLVEIKAPYRRQIGEYPLLEYWIQCQLQMEVCDIDTCDFLECHFEKTSEEEFLTSKLEPRQFKGIYLVFEDGKTQYPPISLINDVEGQRNWANSYQDDNQKVYWKLQRYQIITINRDKEWFNRILPLLKRGHRRMMSFDDSKASGETTFTPLNPKDLSPLIPRKLQPWEITQDLYSDEE